MISSIIIQKKAKMIWALRQAGIQNDDVLNAMESIPREHFITPTMMDQAYEDIAVPIGQGQTISQPSVVAKMIDGLEVTDRHKVLEIGTGTGYQACVLSKVARRVYTIERHRPLYDQAEANFTDLNLRNITALCGDGMRGWPTIHGIDQAPFDRIIVAAAARKDPPPALLDQLAVGGILLIPVGEPGHQHVMRYKKEADDIMSISTFMPVRFVPLLPDIARISDTSKETPKNRTKETV